MRRINDAQRSKHKVITGRLVNGLINKPFWAGDAFYNEKDGSFEVWLSIFDKPWYLSRNKDSLSYTLFRERRDDNGLSCYRGPIGCGFYVEPGKGFINLKIPLLNPKYPIYLSVYPVQ